MNWVVENGVLKLIWTNADDIMEFVNKVVAPNAKAFGVEITMKKAEEKKHQVVRQ